MGEPYSISQSAFGTMFVICFTAQRTLRLTHYSISDKIPEKKKNLFLYLAQKPLLFQSSKAEPISSSPQIKHSCNLHAQLTIELGLHLLNKTYHSQPHPQKPQVSGIFLCFLIVPSSYICTIFVLSMHCNTISPCGPKPYYRNK